jgi:hypothetical protein
MSRYLTFSRLLVLAALIVAVLAAFHVPAPVDLVASALALYFASLLVP